MLCFINNRDLLTWPKRMAEVLADQGHDVRLIDNASTYPPLLEWYDTCPFPVIRSQQNLGSQALWLLNVVPLHDPFVVSDSDLDISCIPIDWPEALTEGLDAGACKCGFSLDDTKIPSANPAWTIDGFCNYPAGHHPATYGPKITFMGKRCLFHRYPVDTTFALYAAKIWVNGFRVGGIRAGHPYTARHLPWHLVLHPNPDEQSLQLPLTEELYYYYTHVEQTASCGSTTAKRLKSMLDEYAGRGNHEIRGS